MLSMQSTPLTVDMGVAHIPLRKDVTLAEITLDSANRMFGWMRRQDIEEALGLTVTPQSGTNPPLD